ncbi:MAG: hypothetical protein ACC682_14965, partial [Gemmatimonadota bacterium]
LAVIALTIIVQLFRGSFGADAPAPVPVPPPAAAVNPSPASPTSEFVGLVDDFLTNLHGFRARLVEFRLGQTDCAGISAEIIAVAAAHGLLEAHVASNPDMSDRFDLLDNEFEATLGRFASTDCPTPAELVPDGDAASAGTAAPAS